MQPEDGAEDEKHPRVPDSVLRAALLRRAVEDIQRLIQIRSSKQACQQLLQRGSVGDDLWQRFKELKDVVQEVWLPPPPFPISLLGLLFFLRCWGEKRLT